MLGFGENATAFAHLDEYGTPSITKFVSDVRAIAEGQTRIYARHAAAFGDVNVLLKKDCDHKHHMSSILIRGLENPDQEGATLAAGDWNLAIYPRGSRQPAFKDNRTLASKFVYLAYAVGSPANGTFTVLYQSIDLNN